jgi:oxygen-independent coproporphyrinogen-3 oxidase
MNHLGNAPAGVDTAEIVRLWEAVKHKYRIANRRMPSPVWAERGYEHDGCKAWQQLSAGTVNRSMGKPLSIYIHIPFCDQRCGFCDCYALPMGRHRQKKEQKYVRVLTREMDAWSDLNCLGQRPVTTIHFGGGTPNVLSPAVMETVVEHCRVKFNVTSETEWALETTGTLMTDEHLNQLREWGFSRLHTGVQTLDDHLRKIIGRRQATRVVLKRLSRALDMGFVVSADIVYGLPGQTIDGLENTIKRLMDIDLHGVSLYRLNLSRRNHWFFKNFKAFRPDAVYDFVLFQIGDQLLTRAGYRKNHFVHFARPKDRNLYFTHAQRGEDLLALGATADGKISHYHYRHPGYAKYVKGIDADIPVLEGGVWEIPQERKLQPVTAALMGGGITLSEIRDLNAEPLLDDFRLTANGSWLVNDMISELKRHFLMETNYLGRIDTRVYKSRL